MQSRNSAEVNSSVGTNKVRVKRENPSENSVSVISLPSTSSTSQTSNARVPPVFGSSVSVTPVSLGPAVSVTPVKPGILRTEPSEKSVSSALNTSADAISPVCRTPGSSPINEPESSVSHSVSVIRTASRVSPSISVEPFTFKTPSPVRTLRNTNTPKPSVSVSVVKTNHSKKNVPPLSASSKSQLVKSEQSLDGEKPSSCKKKPAVKIASFAKTPEADRPTADNSKSSRQNLDHGSFISTQQHSSSVISKQPITQTSLPTPGLNAALRSFFNYSSKPDSISPEQPASRSDSEEEDDEEEILVYMQFDSKLDSDLLQSHTPFKIIGVDSDKPVLQLGNQVFEGNWCDTVGTAVFFEEHASASPGDPVFMKNPPSTLNYHSKTQKGLVMSRIFIKPKDETDDVEEDMDLPSNSASGPMVPIATVEVAP